MISHCREPARSQVHIFPVSFFVKLLIQYTAYVTAIFDGFQSGAFNLESYESIVSLISGVSAFLGS